MKIYQFAAMLNPTEDEKKAGKSSTIIVDVTTVAAANDNNAIVLAGRAIPEQFLACLDRVEVAVRSF